MVFKEWVIEGLQKGSLISACDGSFKPMLTKHGIAAAFWIRGEEENHFIKGTCSTSGTKGDSYRGELLGYMLYLAPSNTLKNTTQTIGKVLLMYIVIILKQ